MGELETRRPRAGRLRRGKSRRALQASPRVEPRARAPFAAKPYPLLPDETHPATTDEPEIHGCFLLGQARAALPRPAPFAAGVPGRFAVPRVGGCACSVAAPGGAAARRLAAGPGPVAAAARRLVSVVVAAAAIVSAALEGARARPGAAAVVVAAAAAASSVAISAATAPSISVVAAVTPLAAPVTSSASAAVAITASAAVAIPAASSVVVPAAAASAAVVRHYALARCFGLWALSCGSAAGSHLDWLREGAKHYTTAAARSGALLQALKKPLSLLRFGQNHASVSHR